MQEVLTSIFVGLFFLSSGIAAASSLEVQKVEDGIYALIGDLEQRSPQNLGNKATFGVIVTSVGVILVDPGGTLNRLIWSLNSNRFPGQPSEIVTQVDIGVVVAVELTEERSGLLAAKHVAPKRNR